MVEIQLGESLGIFTPFHSCQIILFYHIFIVGLIVYVRFGFIVFSHLPYKVIIASKYLCRCVSRNIY